MNKHLAMIERHWKGISRSDSADHYIRLLQKKTFLRLHELRGFVKASILRRPVDKDIDRRRMNNIYYIILP
jgi:hypothetical protein